MSQPLDGFYSSGPLRNPTGAHIPRPGEVEEPEPVRTVTPADDRRRAAAWRVDLHHWAARELEQKLGQNHAIQVDAFVDHIIDATLEQVAR